MVPVLGNVSGPVLGNVSVPVLGDILVPILGEVSVPVLGNVSDPVLGCLRLNQIFRSLFTRIMTSYRTNDSTPCL